jgi:hypothetical protein
MMSANGWGMVEMMPESMPLCTSPVDFYNNGVTIGNRGPSIQFTSAVPNTHPFLGPVLDETDMMVPMMPMSMTGPTNMIASRSSAMYTSAPMSNSNGTVHSAVNNGRGGGANMNTSADESWMQGTQYISMEEASAAVSAIPIQSMGSQGMANLSYATAGSQRRDMSPPFVKQTTTYARPRSLSPMGRVIYTDDGGFMPSHHGSGMPPGMMVTYPGMQMIPTTMVRMVCVWLLSVWLCH